MAHHLRKHPASPLSRINTLALFTGLALTGCSGSDDPAPAAAAAAVPPPAVASTTITGAVVKGPVAGAQVCAYTVQAGGRGTALGACTTTNAAGNYSFAVPADSGPLWVEASGGSYTDETTGAAATLPAGSPLRSIITANSGTVNTMLTPLTTLALNAAAAAAASSGATLDAAAFAAAAAQLLTAFNLPATLNISTTLPTFGTNINSYGTALTAISQMVASGTPLATILATPQATTLAAAFAAALAGPVVVAPETPPTTAGSTSASGSLAVAGTTAAGATTTLAPQADGFEVAIRNGTTSYRFFTTSTAPAKRVEVNVSVSALGALNVSYYDLAARSTFNTCASNCGVSITPAAGATHPVTLVFANTPLTGGITLNGSLVGSATGAAWSLADLPGGTSSSLTLNGNAVRALTAVDNVTDAGNGNLLRSIALQLSDGSTLLLNRSGTAAFTASRIVPPASISSCATGCNVTVADGAGTQLVFNNTPLANGVVVNGTVDYARTSGSLTSSDLGGFTPTASTIEALNNTRTLTFNVLGTAAQAGLSLVTVEVVAGRVVRAQATVGIATQVLSCFDNGAGINVPACTGVTVAADGRSVTFNNAVLYGGAVGAASRNVTFNGTLVAKGS